MLMKLMRLIVFALTAVTVAVFAVVFITEKVTDDKTIPVIKVEKGILEVKAGAKEEELLAGVTAYDEKDGDITDRILVESIGKFSEIGYCKVTYAVSDSDNHLVTARRQIHYTNYKPPKFKLSRPLVFSVYKEMNIVGTVGATDCLDGDISQNVIIFSPDYESGKEGTFTLRATVMNSKGDSAEINLPMLVEKTSNNSPEIKLSEYLIYVKKGKTPDWASYIKDTADASGLDAELEIEIETDYKADKKGMYNIDYYGTDINGYTGHTRLIAVVE